MQCVLDAELVRAVRRATPAPPRRADLAEALELHAERLTGLPLAAPCDVDTAQAFRDALREDVVLNGVRFVGAHRTEAFVAAVKRLVAEHAQPERALLLADRVVRGCSRTLSGADAFFALHELFGSPDLLIKPRARAAPPLDVTLGQDRVDGRLKCRIKSENLFALYVPRDLDLLLHGAADADVDAHAVAVDTQVVALLDLSTHTLRRRLSIRRASPEPPSKLALELRELL